MILDLLFPPRCAFCGRLLDENGKCPDCVLPWVEDGDALQDIGGFLCVKAFYYDGPAKEAIHALKFDRASWRAGVLGRYIAQAAAEYLGGQFDAVTYVPVSWQRNLARGFDQSRLLARSAARVWGIDAEPALQKVRHTRPQSSLDDPRLRHANAEGAYRPRRHAAIAGRRFLLIDDVVTTGSTLSACAATLTAAGAASVVCAALAGGRNTRQGGLKKRMLFR